MSEANGPVRYDGTCPLCGSGDGTIVKGADGRFRNICRVLNCSAHYIPAPAVGWDTDEIAHNPWGQPLLTKGITVGEYIRGEAKA